MPTLTIQPSDIDTYLNSGDPPGNYGGVTYLKVYAQADEISRSILKFDFSALPDGAFISAATLSLYYYSNNALDPVGRIYWAYEVVQTEFVELEATWNRYKIDNNWTAPGGDYTITNGASIVMPAGYGWVSWNVLALVQHFQSVHAEIAYLLIKDETEAANREARFYSNNYVDDTTLCPKLIIAYALEAITADKWFTEMNQPCKGKLEVIGY